jgi:hypothetical protein
MGGIWFANWHDHSFNSTPSHFEGAHNGRGIDSGPELIAVRKPEPRKRAKVIQRKAIKLETVRYPLVT